MRGLKPAALSVLGFAFDAAVEGVAFDGCEAGFAYGFLEGPDIDFLVGGCAADFGDVVPDDGAVDVVRAALEHELGHGEGLHDPEGLDVGEVVEHEPCDGERAEVFQAAGAGEVLELAAIGEEGEGDDGLEVAARRGIRGSMGREASIRLREGHARASERDRAAGALVA